MGSRSSSGSPLVPLARRDPLPRPLLHGRPTLCFDTATSLQRRASTRPRRHPRSCCRWPAGSAASTPRCGTSGKASPWHHCSICCCRSEREGEGLAGLAGGRKLNTGRKNRGAAVTVATCSYDSSHLLQAGILSEHLQKARYIPS
jgi:hypothetical protein